MSSMENKIFIIQQILDVIKSENRLTSCFLKLSGNEEKEYTDFNPEKVYMEFVKKIIDAPEIPENVCAINIYVGADNRIYNYDLICGINKTKKIILKLLFD